VIAVLDYGAGNLRSVLNTLAEIGAHYKLVREPAGVETASKIILPGVGHFGQMMRSLDAMGVRKILIDRIQAGVPFLGICLGLQALFRASEEAPEVPGLALIESTIWRFPNSVRVPHMGWNQLELIKPSRLLSGISQNSFVYFAHSYYAPVIGETVATCTYGVTYSAVIESGNIFGVQFHPEKSGVLGLEIVRNFVNW
jgi:imidazole glycerol phosphate synthase glutamine amidotransferase subunit